MSPVFYRSPRNMKSAGVECGEIRDLRGRPLERRDFPAALSTPPSTHAGPGIYAPGASGLT